MRVRAIDRSRLRPVTASRLAVGALAGICALVYWPVLSFDFVDLDDPLNFVANHGYRGLGPRQLAWMFLEHHGFSAYDPIAWVTFGLDYLIWGVDPRGFHASNLLIYTLAILACYRLMSILLERLAPAPAPAHHHVAAAFIATALLAIHPLRAESVAWLSERHGILAVLFATLSTAAYIRYTDPRCSAPQRACSFNTPPTSRSLAASSAG